MKFINQQGYLEYLDISSNNISDVGFKKICENLQVNYTLKVLKACNNDFTIEALRSFQKVLEENQESALVIVQVGEIIEIDSVHLNSFLMGAFTGQQSRTLRLFDLQIYFQLQNYEKQLFMCQNLIDNFNFRNEAAHVRLVQQSSHNQKNGSKIQLEKYINQKLFSNDGLTVSSRLLQRHFNQVILTKQEQQSSMKIQASLVNLKGMQVIFDLLQQISQTDSPKINQAVDECLETFTFILENKQVFADTDGFQWNLGPSQVLMDEIPIFNFTSQKGYTKFAKICLHAGADLNQKSKEIKNLQKKGIIKTNIAGNQTALHSSIINEQYELSHSLIEMDCDVNCIDDFLNTPLHYAAASKNSKEIIEALIDHGAQKSLKLFNIFGLNPCHSSICSVNIDSLNNLQQIVKMQEIMYKNEKVRTDRYDLYRQKTRDQHETPLMLAIKFNNTQVFNFLVELPDNQEILEDLNQNNESALFIAADSGNSQFVLSLLQKGVRYKKQMKNEKGKVVDDQGFQLLEILVKNEMYECLKWVIQNKSINLYQTNPETGDNLLHIAADRDSIDIINLLIQSGVSTFHENKQHLQPHQCATKQSTADFILGIKYTQTQQNERKIRSQKLKLQNNLSYSQKVVDEFSYLSNDRNHYYNLNEDDVSLKQYLLLRSDRDQKNKYDFGKLTHGDVYSENNLRLNQKRQDSDQNLKNDVLNQRISKINKENQSMYTDNGDSQKSVKDEDFQKEIQRDQKQKFLDNDIYIKKFSDNHDAKIDKKQIDEYKKFIENEKKKQQEIEAKHYMRTDGQKKFIKYDHGDDKWLNNFFNKKKNKNDQQRKKIQEEDDEEQEEEEEEYKRKESVVESLYSWEQQSQKTEQLIGESVFKGDKYLQQQVKNWENEQKKQPFNRSTGNSIEDIFLQHF